MNIMVHKNYSEDLNKIYSQARDDNRRCLKDFLDVGMLGNGGEYLILKLIDSCLKERYVAMRADEFLLYDKSDGFCSMTMLLRGKHIPVKIGVNPYFSGYRLLETSENIQTLKDLIIRSEASMSNE